MSFPVRVFKGFGDLQIGVIFSVSYSPESIAVARASLGCDLIFIEPP